MKWWHSRHLSNSFQILENNFPFLQSFPCLFPLFLGRSLLLRPGAGDFLVGLHHFDVRRLKMQSKQIVTLLWLIIFLLKTVCNQYLVSRIRQVQRGQRYLKIVPQLLPDHLLLSSFHQSTELHQVVSGNVLQFGLKIVQFKVTIEPLWCDICFVTLQGHTNVTGVHVTKAVDYFCSVHFVKIKLQSNLYHKGDIFFTKQRQIIFVFRIFSPVN